MTAGPGLRRDITGTAGDLKRAAQLRDLSEIDGDRAKATAMGIAGGVVGGASAAMGGAGPGAMVASSFLGGVAGKTASVAGAQLKGKAKQAVRGWRDPDSVERGTGDDVERGADIERDRGMEGEGQEDTYMRSPNRVEESTGLFEKAAAGLQILDKELQGRAVDKEYGPDGLTVRDVDREDAGHSRLTGFKKVLRREPLSKRVTRGSEDGTRQVTRSVPMDRVGSDEPLGTGFDEDFEAKGVDTGDGLDREDIDTEREPERTGQPIDTGTTRGLSAMVRTKAEMAKAQLTGQEAVIDRSGDVPQVTTLETGNEDGIARNVRRLLDPTQSAGTFEQDQTSGMGLYTPAGTDESPSKGEIEDGEDRSLVDDRIKKKLREIGGGPNEKDRGMGAQ